MSWKIFIYLLATSTCLLSSTFDCAFATPLLNASSGIYAGRTVSYGRKVVEQYLGIEYGRVHKRFARAAPIVRANDRVINATTPGPFCKPTFGSCPADMGMNLSTASCSISYGIFSVKSYPAEQCLFLNVFIPVTDTANRKKKKAIFMWIHGGSGQIGTGSVFDGTILAALGDIVVVTLNFRLNLFGFLSSGDGRLEGNLGLYDQALVLDWIHQNGHAFGGDVDRITVGGHSAGAPHAYYLAISPLNRGRIRRLLLQSGSPFNVWSHLKAHDAIEKFNTVANDNGCGAHPTFEGKLTCLQERDFDAIAEHEHHSYTSANHTNVVTAGYFMSEFREEFLQNDTLAGVDLLMGSTDDEGVYVAIVPVIMEQSNPDTITLHNVNFTDTALKFLAAMQPDKACLHHKALKLYHIDQVPENCSQSMNCYCAVFYNYSRLITDILFNNDYYRFVEQRVKYSNRTYLYQYSHRTAQAHPTPCNDYFQKQDLVGHFAELEYTWGTPLLHEEANSTLNLFPLIEYDRYGSNVSSNVSVTHVYTREQVQFSKQLIRQWSNFIRNGRPTRSRSENKWPPISNISAAMLMHLRVNGSAIEPLSIPSSVQFWKNECPSDRVDSARAASRHNCAIVWPNSLTMFVSCLLFSTVLHRSIIAFQ